MMRVLLITLIFLVGFATLAFAQTNPIFFHNSGLELKATSCSNATCSTSNSYSLDTQNFAGIHTQSIVPSDGRPFLTYISNQSNPFLNSLYALKCGTPTCSSGNTRTLIATGMQQEKAPIRLNPTTGFPVFLFVDGNSGHLKLVECQDAACGVLQTHTIQTTLIQRPDWIYGEDGAPIIIGLNRILKCGDATCSSYTQPVSYTSDFPVTAHIELSRNRTPVISYIKTNFSQDEVHVVRCLDSRCLSSINQTIDTYQTLLGWTYNHDLLIGKDGLPIISYFYASSRDLKVAKCTNVACSNAILTTVANDPGVEEGYYSSMSIGSNGLPLIGFWDRQNFRMGTITCLNRACSQHTPTRWFQSSGQWVSTATS